MAFNQNLHRNILLEILKDIYTDTTIGPVLGFKGGTAAYLFYDLGRFSVDLDFDLLDESKADYVFDRVEEIIKKHGVIKEKTKLAPALFLLLSYEDKAPNIKVDINLRSFASKYELKSYLGVSMLVMIKEDMFAHKLVAMAERFGKAKRDIFDVWYFAKNHWSVNERIVEERTKMDYKDFLQKCISLLENWNDTAILAGMGDLLDAKQKVWVKAHLKNDTIFLLRVMGDNLTFTKIPPHSFSGKDTLIASYDDIKNGKIIRISAIDENTLAIRVISDTTGHEVDYYIRNKDKSEAGKKDLMHVQKVAQGFIGKTYDELLNTTGLKV